MECIIALYYICSSSLLMQGIFSCLVWRRLAVGVGRGVALFILFSKATFSKSISAEIDHRRIYLLRIHRLQVQLAPIFLNRSVRRISIKSFPSKPIFLEAIWSKFTTNPSRPKPLMPSISAPKTAIFFSNISCPPCTCYKICIKFSGYLSVRFQGRIES